ncbi:MAG: hypothetical protein ABSG28_03685 [Methanoregula sp.]|jgi:CheY-like chemotaxis protein|uniref:hypothetical protein n=1 Tax=Methanoregula sp. TaxID=2052170 RepID=UPI003C1BC46E
MAEPLQWRILVVDDEPKICEQIKKSLDGAEIVKDKEYLSVITQENFNRSLEDLETYKIDLVILDVKNGDIEVTEGDFEEAGEEILKKIHEKRYIPIIFYTALPTEIQHLKGPLIKILQKETDHKILLKPITEILKTPFPSMNRAIISHIERNQADYLRDFVSAHWEQFGNVSDQYDLVHLLLRRFILSISNEGIKQLLKELNAPPEMCTDDPVIHPMQYYVYPPIEPTELTGDIFKRKIGGKEEYLIFLTPSCDLVTGHVKAEKVLLARCNFLSEQKEYQNWMRDYKRSKDFDKNTPSEEIDKVIKSEERLQALLKNNRQKNQPDRFFYLPGVINIPNLIVDFQDIENIEISTLRKMERIASLDSPFAESLSSRFTRYYGRVGSPDLNIEGIFCKFRERCD